MYYLGYPQFRPNTTSRINLNTLSFNFHMFNALQITKCVAGCQCMEDYVWDEETVACVTPTNCPCYHGGRSYCEGENMQQDCNTWLGTDPNIRIFRTVLLNL